MVYQTRTKLTSPNYVEEVDWKIKWGEESEGAVSALVSVSLLPLTGPLGRLALEVIHMLFNFTSLIGNSKPRNIARKTLRLSIP